ncbi:GNAT family N-acetyltransferase [Thalassotalea ponticola]|uniref:GNAT family N-acetyltransferase n=1 Tax=Thalassotalea ponticola TaxID=1523392 RepID=UPI0025B431B1|nr:GNAT family N-acetyltransferase [Thalassotalea ponticola]MDN3653244.1 GNAT family N-acetyltransferase [Thalassotalea ponticola]
MKITVETTRQAEVASFLSKKIVEFNHQHWTVTKQPLALTYRDQQGQILAGVSGVTFGHWLHIERLWVADSLRGKGIGQQLLVAIEEQAKQRQCQFAFVDTLDFQAKPLYQKNGYQVQCTQHDYPLAGKRYYLSKTL